MIAIELFFDPAADHAVRDVWADLERAGIESLASATHGRHHPHLTLAVTEELTPVITERLIAGLPPLPELQLDAVGCFPGRGGVVFLAVRSTAALAEFHRSLHELLDAEGLWQVDQVRPGRFVPHCTVAKGLPEQSIGQAVTIARRGLPISGVATSINAVVVGSGEVSPLR